jgi:hypothetical protein
MTKSKIDDYFGEIGFFSNLKRKVSARSKKFTEVLAI